MNWFKRQHQEVISPEAFTLFLLKQANDNVKDTIQFLEEDELFQDNPILAIGTEHSKLPKVEDELMLFSYFALDYWIQNSVRTQEERDTIREALRAHWRNIYGGDPVRQAVLDTLEERLIAYGQIVNEKKGLHIYVNGACKEVLRILWHAWLFRCGTHSPRPFHEGTLISSETKVCAVKIEVR